MNSSTEELFKTIERRDSAMLSSNIVALSSVESIKKDFVAKDREKLYTDAKPIFDSYKTKFGITHMYFIGLDGKVFLRVHEKKTYGDLVTRQTFLDAQKNKDFATGLELGKTAYALRSVAPYRDNSGKIIGYLELGQEIDHFVSDLSTSTGNNYAVLGNKDYLSQADWLSATKGTGFKWADLNKYVVLTKTSGIVTNGPCLTRGQVNITGSTYTYKSFSQNGESFFCTSIPIKDARGNIRGGLIAKNKITASVANVNRMIVAISLGCLIGFGSLVLFVILYSRRAIIKPLEMVSRRFSTVANEKEGSQIKYSHDDEIGEMVGSVNAMSKRIKDYNEHLEKMVEEKTSELQKFQKAVAGASDHIVITDPEGIVLYANDSVKRITGYPVKDVIGKKAGSAELWGGEMSNDFYKKFWKRIKEDKKPFNGILNNHRKNGQKYLAFATVSPVMDEKGNLAYFTGIERDVTKERESFESAERLANIVTESEDAIYAIDLEGIITSWNPGAEKLFGYTEEDMYGRSSLVLFPEDKTSEFSEIIKKLSQGKRVSTLSTKRLKKNGKEIDVSVSDSPVKEQGGKVVGISVIARDITKEMQIDQAKTEFVSLASHQLRTPLSAINWYAEMLLAGDAGKINKDQKEYLNEIYHGNQRMVELVNALLNVSRLDLGTFEINPKSVKICEVVDDVADEMEHSIKEKNQKLLNLCPVTCPELKADPKLIRIVIQNLLSNAIKYTPKGGKISVTVQYQPKKPKETFVIKVSDTGYGIPLSQQDKIFTKLFRADNVRTKDTEGTGLGLYIIKSIMDEAGGKISFVSKENKGTTFIVTLPATGMKKKVGTKSIEWEEEG